MKGEKRSALHERAVWPSHTLADMHAKVHAPQSQASREGKGGRERESSQARVYQHPSEKEKNNVQTAPPRRTPIMWSCLTYIKGE